MLKKKNSNKDSRGDMAKYEQWVYLGNEIVHNFYSTLKHLNDIFYVRIQK